MAGKDHMTAAIRLAGPAVPSAPEAEEAPPPYTTLPRDDVTEGAAQEGVAGTSAGYNPRGVKLGYVDFVPRCTSKKLFRNDMYEEFDALVQRANTWLQQHRGMKLVSAETITWSGLKIRKIFSDSSSFFKSMNATRQTTFLRGLRLWYFVDVFPDPSLDETSPVIIVRTYIPKHDERFDQLLARINANLAEDRIGGKLLTVETIKVNYVEQNYSVGSVCANNCFWKEQPDDKKMYVLCLRIFAVACDVTGNESIGYQNFVPDHSKRKQQNGGYEAFSDVMQTASRWIAGQRGVRFCNVQSMAVKVKKKGPYEERCVFTEHTCAHNRLNIFKGLNKATDYVRLLRAYYVTDSESSLQDSPVRLTYRTFSPSQLTSATSEAPPEYESLGSIMDRINQWLIITGARCFGFETVALRYNTGNLQQMGPEATFAQNCLQTHYCDVWLYHIRIYLDGEYIEPPGAVSLVIPSKSR